MVKTRHATAIRIGIMAARSLKDQHAFVAWGVARDLSDHATVRAFVRIWNRENTTDTGSLGAAGNGVVSVVFGKMMQP